jgi:hypothetical protein
LRSPQANLAEQARRRRRRADQGRGQRHARRGAWTLAAVPDHSRVHRHAGQRATRPNWDAVDIDARIIHVRHRADLWGTIGNPKSAAGERTIRLAPLVVNALRSARWGSWTATTGRAALPHGALTDGAAIPTSSSRRLSRPPAGACDACLQWLERTS